MSLWKLKSCPRCEGDIFVDRDPYGWYEHCLQCGYRRDLIDIVKLEQQQTRDVKEERRRFKALGKG